MRRTSVPTSGERFDPAGEPEPGGGASPIMRALFRSIAKPEVISTAGLRSRGRARWKTVLLTAAVAALSIGCAANRPPTFCVSLAGAGPESDARDPDASGSAVLQFTGATSIRFSVRTSGIGSVIATHIHRGTAGVNGPMAREINPGFPGDSFSGIASGIPSELLDEIRKNPSAFYLKVHSLRFPGGAIRGQLVKCRNSVAVAHARPASSAIPSASADQSMSPRFLASAASSRSRTRLAVGIGAQDSSAQSR